MALNKAPLKAAIKAAFLTAKAETNPANFDAVMDQIAQDISDAIDVYVKGGDVIVPGGACGAGGANGGTYPVV